MARSHQVALAAPSGRLNEAEPAISDLERAVVLWAGDRDVLVATKDGWVVAVTPADTDVPGPRAGPKTLGDLMVTELERTPRGGPWRVSVGRPTRARTGSPVPMRRPGMAWRWPSSWAWTAS